MYELPTVTEVGPEGRPAADGKGFIVTFNVRAVLVPQLFIAETEITPPVLPAVTLMLFVVEEPTHPEGSVHA